MVRRVDRLLGPLTRSEYFFGFSPPRPCRRLQRACGCQCCGPVGPRGMPQTRRKSVNFVDPPAGGRSTRRNLVSELPAPPPAKKRVSGSESDGGFKFKRRKPAAQPNTANSSKEAAPTPASALKSARAAAPAPTPTPAPAPAPVYRRQHLPLRLRVRPRPRPRSNLPVPGPRGSSAPSLRLPQTTSTAWPLRCCERSCKHAMPSTPAMPRAPRRQRRSSEHCHCACMRSVARACSR